MAATNFVIWLLLQSICAKAAVIEGSLVEQSYDDVDNGDDYYSSTRSIMHLSTKQQAKAPGFKSINYIGTFVVVLPDELPKIPTTVPSLIAAVKKANADAVEAQKARKDANYTAMNQGNFLLFLDVLKNPANDETKRATAWDTYRSKNMFDTQFDSLQLMPRKQVISNMQSGEFCGGVGAGKCLGQRAGDALKVCVVSNPQNGPDIEAWSDGGNFVQFAAEGDLVLLSVSRPKEAVVVNTDGNDGTVDFKKRPTVELTPKP